MDRLQLVAQYLFQHEKMSGAEFQLSWKAGRCRSRRRNSPPHRRSPDRSPQQKNKCEREMSASFPSLFVPPLMGAGAEPLQ